MFGLRKRIQELEARLGNLENGITGAYEPKLDQYARDRMREIVDEQLVRKTLCDHDAAQKVILAVEIYSKDIQDSTFGGLAKREYSYGRGSTLDATTHADRWREEDPVDGERIEAARIYVRRCTICGSVDPVSAFDVAAAGKSIVVRNLRNFESLAGAAPVDGGDPSMLDSLLS